MRVQHRKGAGHQIGRGGTHLGQRFLGHVLGKTERHKEREKRRVNIAGEETFPMVEFIGLSRLARFRAIGRARQPRLIPHNRAALGQRAQILGHQRRHGAHRVDRLERGVTAVGQRQLIGGAGPFENDMRRHGAGAGGVIEFHAHSPSPPQIRRARVRYNASPALISGDVGVQQVLPDHYGIALPVRDKGRGQRAGGHAHHIIHDQQAA